MKHYNEIIKFINSAVRMLEIVYERIEALEKRLERLENTTLSREDYLEQRRRGMELMVEDTYEN